MSEDVNPERVTQGPGHVRSGRAVPSFLIGTAVGGIAGATAGILLGFNMRALASVLARSMGRNRGGDEPRFELLGQ